MSYQSEFELHALREDMALLRNELNHARQLLVAVISMHGGELSVGFPAAANNLPLH
jgi:hypothetical protein